MHAGASAACINHNCVARRAGGLAKVVRRWASRHEHNYSAQKKDRDGNNCDDPAKTEHLRSEELHISAETFAI